MCLKKSHFSGSRKTILDASAHRRTLPPKYGKMIYNGKIYTGTQSHFSWVKQPNLWLFPWESGWFSLYLRLNFGVSQNVQTNKPTSGLGNYDSMMMMLWWDVSLCMCARLIPLARCITLPWKVLHPSFRATHKNRLFLRDTCLNGSFLIVFFKNDICLILY